MIMVVYMFVASAVVLCNSLIMFNSFLLGYLSLRANFPHLHIRQHWKIELNTTHLFPSPPISISTNIEKKGFIFLMMTYFKPQNSVVCNSIYDVGSKLFF